jgi:iron complex transport system permease protein
MTFFAEQTHRETIELPRMGTSYLWLSLLTLGVFILLVLDIAHGSVNIPASEIIKIISGNGTENQVWLKIVFNIRIPKAITAILAGAALSVSGLQMQTLFRNPLAGPSVLGITSGASLGVAILMLGTGSMAGSMAIRNLSMQGSWLIVLASCLGSVLVFLIIIAISLHIKDNVILLIMGMLLSNLIIAVVSIWQYFSEPEQIQDYLIWTFGSLGGVSKDQLLVLAVVSLAGILLTFISSKFLNLLLLGENYAGSMGMNIRLIKMIIIFSTSLLAGAVTGFCGPIGFIGIAVPHLCRALLNTSDHRILIPSCCLAGANIMLLCDIMSQLPGYNTILPINAVTAIFGSPVVMWVILQKRNSRGAF